TCDRHATSDGSKNVTSHATRPACKRRMTTRRVTRGRPVSLRLDRQACEQSHSHFRPGPAAMQEQCAKGAAAYGQLDAQSKPHATQAKVTVNAQEIRQRQAEEKR